MRRQNAHRDVSESQMVCPHVMGDDDSKKKINIRKRNNNKKRNINSIIWNLCYLQKPEKDTEIK